MRRRFPRIGWLGAFVMAAGLGLDVLAHSVLPQATVAAGFTPGQHGAHLVVLVGMVLLLGAIVVDGTRNAADRRQEGINRDALR
jgi:hypothetical protein